ncbi:MAG: bifunctional methylenetetrahydrofolate dehydrogenase/methenyltetrahydrofolate cyclohydrolase FolD [Myxococcota bacterium]
MTQVLDGKAMAAAVREEVAKEVAEVRTTLGRPPGLAVVLVGDDAASAVYVRNKENDAKKVGMHSEVIRLPASTSQQDVEAVVDELNRRHDIDAFLVQLPLPAGLDAGAVTDRIDPEKDADGLHPTNLGRLLAGLPAPRPCTPSGVMMMLDASPIELSGAHAVVIGRSTIVGKPQALMLLERNCTVTLCHSRTRNLADEVRRAQVVVSAVGRANMIGADWIQDGAVVIDVGINRGDDGKLVGDVDYAAVAPKAAAITPVPGGVGPMTRALLLKNGVRAAARAAKR